MQKSFRTTLILLGLCTLLFGWYFLYERKYKVTLEKSSDEAKQAIPFSQDSITEVRIKKGDKAVHLKKIDKDWMLIAPIEDKADTSAVSSLLSTLTSTKQDRVVDEKPEDLALFGLKSPEFEIEAKKDGGAETLLIGKELSVGHGVYAKKANHPAVFKLSQSLRSALDKTTKDFRNKNILPWSSADVQEVELSIASKPSFVVKRQENGNWLLSREGIPADAVQWNQTLSALTDARAIDFASEGEKPLSATGLDKPQLRVELTSNQEPKRLGISFSKVGSKVYAKRNDRKVVFEVSADILTKASRPSVTYYNLDVAKFSRFDVARIQIERGKEMLEMVKEKDGWMIQGASPTRADLTKVDTWLAHLQDARIEEYAKQKGAELGLAVPNMVVRVYEKHQDAPKEAVSLKFGAQKFNRIAVERSGLSLPFWIRLSDSKEIAWTKEQFLPAKEPEKKNEKVSEKKS